MNMTEKQEKCCGTCEHFESKQVGEGLCRYLPPQVYAVVLPGPVVRSLNVQVSAAYPLVKSGDRGCSKHEWQCKSYVETA